MVVPNELLWLGFLLLDLLLAVLVFRIFGKAGLLAYIVLSVITCNLQVIKLVDLFGMTATLGNILYGSIFFCTDLIGEVYGQKEAKRAVWLGFVAVLLMTLFMQIALRFTPSDYDAVQPHLEAIFNLIPRVAVGSLVAYLISQLHDVWAFHWWRERTGGKMLWLRNNLSTAVSQAIDSVVFAILAFAPLPVLGNMPGFDSWQVVWEVALTTYLFKLAVAIVDTPFIYWGRRVFQRFHAQAG